MNKLKCVFLKDEYIMINYITSFYVKDKLLYIDTLVKSTIVIKCDSNKEAIQLAETLANAINE